MALTFGECTLHYLFALAFMAWFVFGILLIAERWGSLSPTKYGLLFAYEMGMALLVRFSTRSGAAASESICAAAGTESSADAGRL